MADNEIEKITKIVHQNEQNDQTIQKLKGSLNVYSDSIAIKNLLQQNQDAEGLNTQQGNEEINQRDPKTNIHNIDEKERNIEDIIANNTFRMRLNVLKMEINVVKAFLEKNLIDKDNTIRDIEASISNLHNINNFKETENELLVAENFSFLLMEKIERVVENKSSKKEVKKPRFDTELPYYKSTLTVRSTEEDVIDCTQLAIRALDTGKYERAERMLPTESARNLLIKVWATKKLNQNSGIIQKPIKAVEQVNIVKEEESTTTSQQLRAAEESYQNSDPTEKAIRTGEQVTTVKEEDSTTTSQQLRAAEESYQNSDPTEKAIGTGEQVNAVKEDESLITSQKNQAAEKSNQNSEPIVIATEAVERVNTVKDQESTITSQQVQAAEGSNQNSDPEKAIEAVEQVTTVKEEESTIVSQQVQAAKKIIPNTEVKKTFNTVKKDKEVSKPKGNNKNTTTSQTALDTELPYYRSTLTVRGTKEDVIDCIQIAKRFLDNGKYDKAESLLLKAERMLPTESARNLLIKVRAAKKLNQNSVIIQKPIEAVEQVNIVKEEQSTTISHRLRAAEESNQNSDPTEKAIEVVEQVTTVKEEDSTIVSQVQAAKKLIPNTEAEETFNTVKKDKEVSKPDANNKNTTTSQTALEVECSKSSSNFQEAGRKLNKDFLCCSLLSLNEDAIYNKTSVSQPSSDNATTTETVKKYDYFKRDKETEILIHLAETACGKRKFGIVHYYLEKLQSKADPIDIDLREKVQLGKDSQSESFNQLTNDIKLEAIDLLKDAEHFIRDNDLEKAESYLVISWDMNRRPENSTATVLVCYKFLDARLALYRVKENRQDGILDQNSKNIFKSDGRVKSALAKHNNKKTKEFEESLRKAAEMCPNDRIYKLLLEIIETENNKIWLQKNCSIV